MKSTYKFFYAVALIIFFLSCSKQDKIIKENYNKEKIRLEKYKHFIQRKSDTLIIKLNNNKTITIKNNRENDTKKYQISLFEKYYPNCSSVLISNTFYENVNYSLINLNSGQTLELKDIPYFSPNNRQIIVCLHIPMLTTGIYIYSYNNNEFNESFKNEELGFGPKDPKWTSDYEISFTKEIRIDENNKKTEEGKLIKEDGSWILNK